MFISPCLTDVYLFVELTDKLDVHILRQGMTHHSQQPFTKPTLFEYVSHEYETVKQHHTLSSFCTRFMPCTELDKLSKLVLLPSEQSNLCQFVSLIPALHELNKEF